MNLRMVVEYRKVYSSIFAADNPAIAEDLLFLDMIGKSSVGKSALIQSFLLGRHDLNAHQRNRLTIEIGSIARGTK